MPPKRGTMLTVEFLRRTNVALVVLTGVACTKIIGLPELPELGGGGSSGSGQSGGTGLTGGSVSSGGRSANGGAVSSGGSGATGGSVGEAGGESGASSGSGGSSLGGTSGAGGLTGGVGGSGGTVSSGGSSATGGSSGDGGRGSGGSAGTGGSDVGGISGAGASMGGGMSGAGGAGGAPGPSDGPCDIYAAADTPCVAAYSTIRLLSKTYTGPLYQVRSGSSAQNTGTGGITYNIGVTADGFADAAAHDAACADTICTISLLYDQSGNDNHLSVAKKGPSGGPMYSDLDDFESNADGKALTVGDHNVYALYMAARQGYRLPAQGNGVPVGTAAQGLYMLADGTHYGTQCCWEFGNVTVDPMVFKDVNSLFFGTAYWGKGDGAGPWFMADFGNGIWAGGSATGDPGSGSLNDPGPASMENPSLRVAFALGFLKTDSTKYALRMADAQTAANLTTAYQGNLPQALTKQGAIVLGVGPDNSNASYGTFYEGAMLSGFPTDGAELDVLENIKAAGYGQ